MINEQHPLVLSRLAQRKARDVQKNLADLVGSVNNRALEISGWRIDIDQSVNDDGWTVWGEPGSYEYRLYLTVNYTSNADKKPDPHRFQALVRGIATKAAQVSMRQWTLIQVDGFDYEPLDEGDLPIDPDKDISYAELTMPEDWESYFDHLYGLEAQVGIVKSAIEAGMESNWRNRFNVVLYGAPGSGKTDLADTVLKALGEEAVARYDATAMTQAGVIKDLAEREILPRVALFEEIEKVPNEKDLAPLLGILDTRGEIRKITARASVQRDTRILGIATVNDKDKFDRLLAGALSSRFTHGVYFKHPSRTMMEKILQREIAKLPNGNDAWITPALDYADSRGIHDPRRVIAITLSGRDALVTGEYQKMLDAVSEDIQEADDFDADF